MVRIDSASIQESLAHADEAHACPSLSGAEQVGFGIYELEEGSGAAIKAGDNATVSSRLSVQAVHACMHACPNTQPSFTTLSRSTSM
jgi:hypothetical protein